MVSGQYLWYRDGMEHIKHVYHLHHTPYLIQVWVRDRMYNIQPEGWGGSTKEVGNRKGTSKFSGY